MAGHEVAAVRGGDGQEEYQVASLVVAHARSPLVRATMASGGTLVDCLVAVVDQCREHERTIAGLVARLARR